LSCRLARTGRRFPQPPSRHIRRFFRTAFAAVTETTHNAIRVSGPVEEVRPSINDTTAPLTITDDEGTKASGGDLGWVGKGVLVDALDEAMAAMEPNDIRGPIRTERGWVVLQLVERKSGDLRPYEEIKEQLRKQLYDQQVEKAQQSWLRELRKKSHVDVRL